MAFIVKLGRCMGRCRSVIDDTIPSFPDFANFCEMCLSSWRRGDKRLEEVHRPIGFIHFCLLSADRGRPSLSFPLSSFPHLLSTHFLFFFITILYLVSPSHFFPSLLFCHLPLFVSSPHLLPLCHKSVVFLLFLFFPLFSLISPLLFFFILPQLLLPSSPSHLVSFSFHLLPRSFLRVSFLLLCFSFPPFELF